MFLSNCKTNILRTEKCWNIVLHHVFISLLIERSAGKETHKLMLIFVLRLIVLNK